MGAVLSLVLFLYAELGLELFSFLRHQQSINAERNFETFGGAMLLMFQVLTHREYPRSEPWP